MHIYQYDYHFVLLQKWDTTVHSSATWNKNLKLLQGLYGLVPENFYNLWPFLYLLKLALSPLSSASQTCPVLCFLGHFCTLGCFLCLGYRFADQALILHVSDQVISSQRFSLIKKCFWSDKGFYFILGRIPSAFTLFILLT